MPFEERIPKTSNAKGPSEIRCAVRRVPLVRYSTYLDQLSHQIQGSIAIFDNVRQSDVLPYRKATVQPQNEGHTEGACLGLSDDKVILVTGGGGIGRSTVYELRWLMDKAGSAIANALFDAVGVRLREGPFTPQRVLAAMQKKV